MNELLTTGEVANMCKVKPQLIKRLRAKPNAGPPPIRIGRLVRYDPSAVKQWLDSRTEGKQTN